VVLLETSELLLDEHAATVVVMMAGQVLNILHARPPIHPLLLTFDLFHGVRATEHAQNHEQPEATISGELKVTIVVHRVGRPRDIEAALFVTEHVSLEFNCVFRVDNFGIWVVEIDHVVDLRLMEFTWIAHSGASEGTSTLLGDTTTVVTQVIHIVLLSLLFQLSEASLCVATLARGRSCHITSLVTRTNIVALVELILSQGLELLRVLLSQEIV